MSAMIRNLQILLSIHSQGISDKNNMKHIWPSFNFFVMSGKGKKKMQTSLRWHVLARTSICDQMKLSLLESPVSWCRTNNHLLLAFLCNMSKWKLMTVNFIFCIYMFNIMNDVVFSLLIYTGSEAQG